MWDACRAVGSSLSSSSSVDRLDTIRGAARGIDRRTIITGAAWAAPVIVLATAAPAAAAQRVPPAPPYSGPALVAIGAGAGPANNLKIYKAGAGAAGEGPTRGTGNLAPGVRFGWINPTSAKPVTVQTATLTFTPLTADLPEPNLELLFEKFNALTFTRVGSGKAASYTYTVRVDPAAADPRTGVTGVISFTVRSNPANRGTFNIVSSNGRAAQFEIRSFDTAAAATHLTTQTSY
jgi:hypothetical protein